MHSSTPPLSLTIWSWRIIQWWAISGAHRNSDSIVNQYLSRIRTRSNAVSKLLCYAVLPISRIWARPSRIPPVAKISVKDRPMRTAPLTPLARNTRNSKKWVRRLTLFKSQTKTDRMFRSSKKTNSDRTFTRKIRSSSSGRTYRFRRRKAPNVAATFISE